MNLPEGDDQPAESREGLRLPAAMADRLLASPGRVAMSLVLAGALLVLVGSAGLAARSDVFGWEERLTAEIVDLPGGVTGTLRVVMLTGNRLAVAAVALLFLIVDRPRRAGVMLLAGWGAWLAAALAKLVIDRPRPSADVLGYSPEEFVSGPGFPSSHAAVAAALAVVVITAVGVPRALKVVVVLAAALTLVARVHLAVHWPLDVVGGVAVGVLVGGFVVVALDPARVPAAWPGVGRWPPPPAVVTRPRSRDTVTDETLRVATFNIRNGWALDGRHAWPFRRRATAAAVAALDADVIGLQEVYAFQRRWIARQGPDRGWVGAGRTDGVGRGEQCPITWRPSRLRLEAWEVRWFSDRPDVPGSRFAGARVPRIATLARFHDLRSGRVFGVANAHLDAAHPALRARAAELLVEWTAEQDLPWIMLGDLNDDADSEPVAVLEEAGLTLVATSSDAGTVHQFSGRADGRRIDHVLVDGHWSPVSGEVLTARSGRLPSDHWPVVVELRRTTAPT